MSLILDALKKSEAERQRGQVPTILSPQPVMPSLRPHEKRSFGLWWILPAAILAGLAIAYAMTQMRNNDSAIAAPAPIIRAAVPENIPAPINPPTPALPATPDLSAAPALQVAEKPAVSVPVPVVETPQALSTAAEPPPVVESTAVVRIASLAEMPSEQRQQLPSLKLSMHVYSSEASKRFAIIDGQRVNEGSALGGAVVEQINQDGVVLSVQGQTYLLPRP